MSEETIVSANEAAGLQDDVLSTTELAAPKAEPDAHRAVINGVTLERYDNEKESVAMKFSVTSTDVPTLDQEYSLFLPKMFVENIHVDPNQLPSEEGNNQKFQYTLGIANDTKDATLQQLRRIAYEQGRSVAQGTPTPTTIEEYTELFNNLLTGINVVFTRRTDKKADDPRFRNRLKVSNFYSPTIVNSAKSLKNYRKMWLEVQG